MAAWDVRMRVCNFENSRTRQNSTADSANIRETHVRGLLSNGNYIYGHRCRFCRTMEWSDFDDCTHTHYNTQSQSLPAVSHQTLECAHLTSDLAVGGGGRNIRDFLLQPHHCFHRFDVRIVCDKLSQKHVHLLREHGLAAAAARCGVFARQRHRGTATVQAWTA